MPVAPDRYGTSGHVKSADALSRFNVNPKRIMIVHETKLNIKSWSPDDRPREKLLLKGTSALSDAELIAILIGSGTTTLSAVELSKLLLKTASNNLNELARLSAKDLMKIKGTC